MIDVTPMPNELCIGHHGRLTWINGCRSAKEGNDLIQATAIDRSGIETAELPKLHLLALVSNIPAINYARQHSMLPAMRVAAKRGADMPHGAENALGYSHRLGMLTQRRGAYCCPNCIEEDLQHFGFSWFRRMHHLVGVDWCAIHRCTLFRIDDPTAFSRVPHIWLTKNKLIPLDACHPQLPEDGFLARYVDVAIALLSRDCPLPAEKVNGKLAERARNLEPRVSRSGQRPLISDRLFEFAPAQWLQQHLPGFGAKIPQAHFQHIDSIASTKTCAGTGDAYAMSMAVLYESAEAAVSDVISADISEQPSSTRRKAVKRGAQFWRGEIWSHYLASQGSFKEMADRLQIERRYLGERLSDLGLPSLHDIDHSAKWHAFVRFCQGQSLAESCAQENVELVELETLLRKCSVQVFSALQKIKTTRHRESGTSTGGTVNVCPESRQKPGVSLNNVDSSDVALSTR